MQLKTMQEPTVHIPTKTKRVEEEGGSSFWKAPLKTSEKVMIVIGILGLIGIIIRYVIL